MSKTLTGEWSAERLKLLGVPLADSVAAELVRRGGEPTDADICALAHGEIPPGWRTAQTFRESGDSKADKALRLHGTDCPSAAVAGMVPGASFPPFAIMARAMVSPPDAPGTVGEAPSGRKVRKPRVQAAPVPPVPPESPVVVPPRSAEQTGGAVTGIRCAAGRIPLAHLSFSRLDKAAQCLLAYWARYHEHTGSEPADALELGGCVHKVLEAVVRRHVDGELAERVDVDLALTMFRERWAEQHIIDPAAYRDGEAMIRVWAASEGILDGRNVLAVEREIDLRAGPYQVTGYLDRVDQIDDDTIEVVDYKTNRALYARHEVDESLQLSIYDLAARQIWPWAKTVRLSYRMLRHGCAQSTNRTDADRASTLGYLGAMGNRLSNCSEWPARLNEHCSWCDFRAQCGVYQDALSAPQGPLADLSDILAVARERERVAAALSALNARKKSLDKAINACLAEQGELRVDDVTYCQYQARAITYPLDATAARLAYESGRSVADITSEIAEVSNTRVNELVASLRPKKAEAELLKLELEANATVTISPRLWAKKNRSET
ncbi:MAG: PD-(D/E)XK nuclease family protein [Chloroflexota bacterium]